jgi:hypothetical protein
LLSPFIDYAVTQFKHVLLGGIPAVTASTSARIMALFSRAVDISFDREDGLESPEGISLLFGENSPFTTRHLTKVLKEYGIEKTGDGSLKAVQAPVDETYSVYAPITRSIQGSQAITVGIGEDKDGNPVNTAAPVDITLGQQADITIVSESGASLSFDKPVSLTLGSDAGLSLTSESGFTASFDTAVNLTTGGALSMEVNGDAKMFFGNSAESLRSLFTGLVDQIKQLKTFGSPGAHTVDPTSITALEAFVTNRVDALLEGGA